MSRPSCAGSESERHCERVVARYREGTGYCLFHPDAEPPVIDPKIKQPVDAVTRKPTRPVDLPKADGARAPGRVVEGDLRPNKTPADVTPSVTDDPDGLLELQAELDELKRTDPTVAAAAASYDAAVDRILTRDPETPTEGEVPDHSTGQGEVSRQAAATKAHDGADSHDVGPVECETTPASRKGDRGEQPAPAAPLERHRAVGDPCAVDGRPAAEHASPDPITETAVPQPETDLLTLQIAWSVAARYSSETHSSPAVRQVAREARRALGVLVDQLKHDGAGAHAVMSPSAADEVVVDELRCRKGCGKAFTRSAGRGSHEHHCKHQAVSA